MENEVKINETAIAESSGTSNDLAELNDLSKEVSNGTGKVIGAIVIGAAAIAGGVIMWRKRRKKNRELEGFEEAFEDDGTESCDVDVIDNSEEPIEMELEDVKPEESKKVKKK